MRSFRFILALLLAFTVTDANAFIHHKLVGISAPSGTPPPSWSNTYSCKYAGTSTSTAARTNWGQPSAWCLNPAANAYSFSFWFRSNTGGSENPDGALLTAANQAGNSHMRTATSGTAITSIYAGGNFVSGGCSASITANTWTLVTYAFDGAGNAKMYVGNTSTSCITFSTVGTQTCTMDFLFNTLRGSDNTNVAFGEWGTPHMDEFTVWDTEVTGTDHQAMIDGSGHAVDPTTHSLAGNLIDYYRCGDDPSDSSTTLYDQIGSVNGTHSGSDGLTYVTNVP